MYMPKDGDILFSSNKTSPPNITYLWKGKQNFYFHVRFISCFTVQQHPPYVHLTFILSAVAGLMVKIKNL